jgi:hypothetical protein
MRKSLLMTFLLLTLILGACGGASLEGEEVTKKVLELTLNPSQRKQGLLSPIKVLTTLSKKFKFKWNLVIHQTSHYGHNQVQL